MFKIPLMPKGPEVIEHTYSKESQIRLKLCPFLKGNCVGSDCAVWVSIEVLNFDKPLPLDGRCGAICIREDK